MNRAASIVAALAVVGVLGGCGQQPGSTPRAGSPATPSTEPAGPSARTISVTVRDGQATGDTGRVEVPLGTSVTLSVTSDVADEIHLHGYDQEVRIPAGGTGSVSFTADIPGVFEVELHESGLALLQLQVR